MLNKSKKSKSEGFTIIEVLIVLAIAGLIMLIVLLAVPALQRNSRNTSRKNDVGRVASAVQTVLGNNNGAMTSLTNANLQAELNNLSYYTNTNVTMAGSVTHPFNNSTIDTVRVVAGAKCGTGANSGSTAAGSTRQVAIVYSVESGSGTVRQCQEV